jgi:dTDP-glucose pyrophosphorylase
VTRTHGMETVFRHAVSQGETLRDVLMTLERGGGEIALVVDGHKLVGVVTDGAVRRALLAGESLAAPLAPLVNRRCVVVGPGADRAEVLELMRTRRVGAVPIVEEDQTLVGLHLLQEVLGLPERENWAVVMCGGRGARLGPLTDAIPKPMLEVAGRPILERIVLLLAGQGIKRIYLAVHYLASVIEQHFGDGARLGVDVRYLREEKPLGTGGALSLLPDAPTAPLVVMNGDLVTQARVGDMIDSHVSHGAMATIGVRRYRHVVPFGCVEVDGGRVLRMEEKPALSKLVNTGLYVLEPAVVARVPKGQEFGLPSLLDDCLQRGERVQSFEVVDDWIDVGQRERLLHARGEKESEG